MRNFIKSIHLNQLQETISPESEYWESQPETNIFNQYVYP